MPTALNRLLERPSALRLLRSIVHHDAFPQLDECPTRVCQYHSTSHQRVQLLRETSRSWSYRGQKLVLLPRRGPRATVGEKVTLAQLRELVLKETETPTSDPEDVAKQEDQVKVVKRVRLSSTQYAAGFGANGKEDEVTNGADSHAQTSVGPIPEGITTVQGRQESFVPSIPLRRSKAHSRRQPHAATARDGEPPERLLPSSATPFEAHSTPASTVSPTHPSPTSHHSPPAQPGLTSQSPIGSTGRMSPANTVPDMSQENMSTENMVVSKSQNRSPAPDSEKVRHAGGELKHADRPTRPSSKPNVKRSTRVIRKLWAEVQQLGMDLPTSGPDARYIWTIFLSVDDIRPQVVEYAIALRERTGRSYSGLLSRYLLSDFVRQPLRAFAMYERMKNDWTLVPGTMKKLASVAPMTAMSLGTFETIYKQSNQNDVYDVLIDRILGAGLHTLAFQFDTVLRQRHDKPSTYFEVHLHPRFIDACRSRELDRESANTNERLSANTERTANSPPSTTATAPSPSMDRFCARLFATSLLSLNTMIGFARMRGATSIGPLGLRTIAMGSQNSEEFLRTIELFADENLRPCECTFNIMLMRFARLKRDDLWGSLVDSDQHPDVLEDLSKQHQLLGWQLAVQEDKQAEVTLHILTYLDPEPAVQAWNMVLQTWTGRVGSQVPRPLLRVIEEMLILRIPFSTESLKMLKPAILRRRRIGRAPDKSQTKDYPDEQLLANIYRRISENGQDVDWYLWKEILKRQGAAYKQPDFERLCYWLHWWHGPRSLRMYWRYAATSLRSPHHVLPEYSPTQTMERIFNAYMIWAIIHWGFKAAFSHVRPRSLCCLQGLRLLARLRDRGLPIKDQLVRRALSQRMFKLFKQRTFRTRWNRTAKRRNPDSWELLVRESEKIWGKPIWHRLPGQSEPLLEATAHFSGMEPRLPREKFMDRERRALTASRRKDCGLYAHLYEHSDEQEMFDEYEDTQDAEPEDDFRNVWVAHAAG